MYITNEIIIEAIKLSFPNFGRSTITKFKQNKILNENPSNMNDAIILKKTLINEFDTGFSNVLQVTS